MRTLYLDCFAGIAGDMLIGALLGFLPDAERFRAAMRRLTALSEDDYELVIEKGAKSGIAGINFDVRTHNHHPHRGLQDIEAIIVGSELSERVRRESLRAFALLAESEAQVHGTTPDQIRFHEVGAIDSIIDIVGAFVLLEFLDWPRVLCSPLNVGSGTVTCAHGVLPVPAPATALLLRGLPVFSQGAPMERTTPTGALLARSLASAFCSLPSASSYGLGNRDSDDMPNVLRALMMESGREDEGLVHERLTLLECNIDDMNPQDFEPVSERLFGAGALDVWAEPIYMKKGRPAVRFCCLAESEKIQALTLMMLKETTSQGVRRIAVDRARLNFRIDRLTTSLGALNVKTALLGDIPLRRTPEYEDLKRLSAEHGLPMAEIRRRVGRDL